MCHAEAELRLAPVEEVLPVEKSLFVEKPLLPGRSLLAGCPVAMKTQSHPIGSDRPAYDSTISGGADNWFGKTAFLSRKSRS